MEAKAESDWCWKRVASRFRAWKRLSELFDETTAETISESDRRKRPWPGEVKLKANLRVAFATRYHSKANPKATSKAGVESDD